MLLVLNIVLQLTNFLPLESIPNESEWMRGVAMVTRCTPGVFLIANLWCSELPSASLMWSLLGSTKKICVVA